ncbi:MAG TPA: hypothetical protein VGC87_21240 [Pyrinomonadaceae bacterium]|jgi:hypothetical protein
MPGCVLRAAGDGFQVEKFLETCTLSPCNVFRKGERKSRDRVWDTSGITVVVSDASGDEPDRQVREAVSFLKAHRDELARLRAFDGVTEMGLDFGLNRKNGFAQYIRFPAELTAIAGELRMGIEVSIYGEGADIG